MTEPEEASPVAALISTLASGQGTQADHDRLLLRLIEQAQARGASWEQLARVLGYPTGREAKRAAHRLEAELRRADADVVRDGD